MTGSGSTASAGAAAGDLRRRQGETVLITGASSGIGRELARLFAGDGADLVLIARSEGGLRELAGELAATYGVEAQVVPADLTWPAQPRPGVLGAPVPARPCHPGLCLSAGIGAASAVPRSFWPILRRPAAANSA